jgi:hypothetical protein
MSFARFSSYCFRLLYRTLATAVIVVQQHPIIQTIADRVVKVSCVMSDFYGKGLVRPNIPNITLETDFGVAEPK